jgi:hypothetical protein
MSYEYSSYGSRSHNSPFTYQLDSPFHIPAYNGPNTFTSNPATDYAATSHGHDNDNAYHANSGYNDYLGNNHQDSPSPESQAGYHEELTRRAAEYGVTPQGLQAANEECIREQEELM